jgi:hypothetical protein
MFTPAARSMSTATCKMKCSPEESVAASVHLTDIGPIPGTVFTVEGDHRREP